MLRQQDSLRGKARDRLELSSSRHPSREDPLHHNFLADVTVVAGRDTSHSSVSYRRQDLMAQDRFLAHLSRRMHDTLITFQEVEDPIDRVSRSSSSSSKAVSSRSQVFRHHIGYWYMLRSHRARDAVV
jgi:hypothetical protein